MLKEELTELIRTRIAFEDTPEEITDQLLKVIHSRIKERAIVDIGIGNNGSDYSNGWYKAMDYVSKVLDEELGKEAGECP